MPYNFGDLFEHAVDAVPEKPALIASGATLTYAQLEDRVNRLGHHLLDEGIEAGDHVGIYGLNSAAWVEALLAVCKVRAVPVNINYRYVADELRYLFANADLKGLFYDQQFGRHVAAVRDSLPLLKTLVVIQDSSGGLGEVHDDSADDGLDATSIETAIAEGSPQRDFPERSGDDRIIIYTGGTTGMPKGVIWRSEDIFFALAGGIDPFTREPVASEHEHAEKAAGSPGQLVFMIAPPLMHGAAFVATTMQLFQGNVCVIVSKWEARDVWRQIELHRVNSILIVGDAMGRPLIEALEELDAEGETLDLSCFLSVSSSAAIFSPTVKDEFLDRFPNLVITDSIGATESGFNGLVTVGKGAKPAHAGGPTVAPGKDTVVLDDDLYVLAPGTGVIGKVARGGNIPLGYYKDPEKTAETWVTAKDGRRYAMPGDFALFEADGTITLLGRGSVCINTGGEKVHPEEVEQALKAHRSVFDAVVVGVPDDRWGQRVAAIVQAREGKPPSLEDLDVHCRNHVAGYKVPRELHLVDEIVRSPSGKPDYRWAAELAASGDHRV